MGSNHEPGVMTADEFNEAVISIEEKSKILEDRWLLEKYNSGKTEMLLLKRSSKIIVKVKTSSEPTNILQDMEEDSECIDSMVIRECSVVIPESCEYSDVICRIEHHILYSLSYAVPTILFNVYKPDGSLISLDDLWYNIKLKTSIDQNLWSVVTQQEHPVLHRPFFYIHPCHTSELLKVLEKSSIVKLSPSANSAHDIQTSARTTGQGVRLVNKRLDVRPWCGLFTVIITKQEN